MLDPNGYSKRPTQALAAEQLRPPEGVSWADWERVVAARRAEAAPIEELRRLGPRLAADEVLLTVDEVLTPKADGCGRWELRTAKLVTPRGYRYLSGTGATFLPSLLALTLAAVGRERALLLSDGARWIRTFFSERLAQLPQATHLLDWYLSWPVAPSGLSFWQSGSESARS